MLVEDDNNLREIYAARLLAEGYEIVSAKDGEEALALAVQEKPDLIISDIMMPKISGFDMLDIIRSTADTKNTKVIMMTALSQIEDKNRAEKLGADKYLVKSQVTLEDVAKAAIEVLSETDKNSSQPTSISATTTISTPSPIPAATPVAPLINENVATDLQSTPIPANPITITDSATTASLQPEPSIPAENPASIPSADATASVLLTSTNGVEQNIDQSIENMGKTLKESSVETNNISGNQTIVAGSVDSNKTSNHTKILTPINDLNQQSDNLQKLAAEEEAKENMPSQDSSSMSGPVVNDITPPDELKKLAEEAEVQSSSPSAPINPAN